MAKQSARERMVASAREMIRRRGVAGTSMIEVLTAAGASRGSLYHYFPGGKTEMIEDATRSAIADYTDVIELLAGLEPEQAVPLLIEGWKAEVEASGFTAGCPVVAAAMGGEYVPTARAMAGEAFTRWSAQLERMLVNTGVAQHRVQSLATLVLSAVEGAVIMGLAQHSSEPLRRVGAELLTLIQSQREDGPR
ncbi:TetR/AcrR family transcriptional regulator [Nocardia sp. A7]|uniref:TetR/AcrR family transcriptional regulator n=1 Tax=Nocardia sp. A7 TaxID=2789274 RepID=UPI00397E7C37